MPRPPYKRKRSKEPQPIQRVANNKLTSPRLELERKLASKPVGTRPIVDSDDSDNLVTRGQGQGRRFRRNAHMPQVFASGGVGKGDVPGSHPSAAPRRQSAMRIAQTIRRQDDFAATLGTESQSKSIITTSVGPTTRPLAPTGLISAQSSTPMPPIARPASTAPTPLFGTPNQGASILRTLKPRKREPSILQLVGNHDSSSLNIDDEAEFLPDAESTPIRNYMTGTAASPLKSILKSSVSQKRKISLPASPRPEPTPITADTSVIASAALRVVDSPYNEPELPQVMSTPVKATSRKVQRDADDIMAPPESSSSPIKSPAKLKEPSPIKKSNKRTQARPLNSLSTEALQAMMPKRTKFRQRRNQRPTEFDIPFDSSQSDESLADIEKAALDDEDSFIPSASKLEASQERFKEGNDDVLEDESSSREGACKGQEEADRHEYAMPEQESHAATVATPLRNSPAKSPSQQPQLPYRLFAYDSRKHQQNHQKILRFFPPQRGGRDGSVHDKENRPESFLGREVGAAGNEIGEVEGRLGTGVELQAMKVKFAEIDDWNMDFEEVDISSSDPMIR